VVDCVSSANCGSSGFLFSLLCPYCFRVPLSFVFLPWWFCLLLSFLFLLVSCCFCFFLCGFLLVMCLVLLGWFFGGRLDFVRFFTRFTEKFWYLAFSGRYFKQILKHPTEATSQECSSKALCWACEVLLQFL